MVKLRFASETERSAIEWVKAQYGRGWRAQIADPTSVEERAFPYAKLKHFVARPYGHRDWNVKLAHARNCFRRNLVMPDLAKRMEGRFDARP